MERWKSWYALASLLMEFLIERGIITIISNRKKEGEPTKVKGGEYIVKSTAYVQPLFELNILPFAMSLPMICPPNKWKVVPHRQKDTIDSNLPPRVSDLVGGYLTPEAAELSQRYRLLTSNSLLCRFQQCRMLQTTMLDSFYTMQTIPFMVNSRMLSWDNVEHLAAVGLLMPPFLATVNPSLVGKELQRVLCSGRANESIRAYCIFSIGAFNVRAMNSFY